MPTTAREIEDEVLAQAAIAAEPSKSANGNGNGNGKNGSGGTAAGLDPVGFAGLSGGSEANGQPTDWSRSYHGLSVQPFDEKVSEILLAPVDPMDIEMKPGVFLLVFYFLTLWYGVFRVRNADGELDLDVD